MWENLQLFYFGSELFYLLELSRFDEVDKLDALHQLCGWLLSLLVLGCLLFDATQSESHHVQNHSAVFASVEAQSYLFRPIVDNQIYEVVNVYAIENLSYWWLTISTSSKITKEKIYSLKHCKCISQCLQWPLNQLLKLISLLLSDILPLLYELHFLFLSSRLSFNLDCVILLMQLTF